MITSKMMAANAAAPVVGVATAAFAKAYDLDIWGWVWVAAIVAGSIIAGAMALISEVQTQEGATAEEVTRVKRRVVGRFGAQFLLGMMVARYAEGDLRIIIPACLILGGGPVARKMVADLRKAVAGADEEKRGP